MEKRPFCPRRVLVLAALLLPFRPALPASASIPEDRPSRLRLYNLHTGQRIDVVYRKDGVLVAESVDKLDRFLRDYRTGTVRRFDPRLFDLLRDLVASVGRPGAELEVVCGYRTKWSNEYLRHHTAGVAAHSLHMAAKAIDIRLPGVSVSRLRRAALALARGGVGYYPEHGFIHVDTGRFRRW